MYAMYAMQKAGGLSNVTITFHSQGHLGGHIYAYPSLINLGLASLSLPPSQYWELYHILMGRDSAHA